MLSKRSQSEHAYTSILDHILRGQLAPGAPLSRRGLAQALGLGVRPVTEALQRLEVEGLVESLPRVGTRVRLPSEQDIRGHYIVREALETQSARLFAEKGSDQERKELVAMAKNLDELYATLETVRSGAEDWESYSFELHNIHLRFHMRIAECSGCPALCTALEKNQILVWNWVFDTAFYSRPTPTRWHGELMDSLNTGDVEIAGNAMRTHVRFRMEEVIRRREMHLTYPHHASTLAAVPVANTDEPSPAGSGSGDAR